MKGVVSLSVGDTFTQEDINLGEISFTNNQTSLFSDTLKVDITNSENGWLANQVINLSATTLSTGSFDLLGLTIYPNPSKDIFNLELSTNNINNISVKIINIVGEIIFEDNLTRYSGTYKQTVDLTSYSIGVYLFKLDTDNGTIIKKLIRQ